MSFRLWRNAGTRSQWSGPPSWPSIMTLLTLMQHVRGSTMDIQHTTSEPTMPRTNKRIKGGKPKGTPRQSPKQCWYDGDSWTKCSKENVCFCVSSLDMRGAVSGLGIWTSFARPIQSNQIRPSQSSMRILYWVPNGVEPRHHASPLNAMRCLNSQHNKDKSTRNMAIVERSGW